MTTITRFGSTGSVPGGILTRFGPLSEARTYLGTRCKLYLLGNVAASVNGAEFPQSLRIPSCEYLRPRLVSPFTAPARAFVIVTLSPRQTQRFLHALNIVHYSITLLPILHGASTLLIHFGETCSSDHLTLLVMFLVFVV